MMKKMSFLLAFLSVMSCAVASYAANFSGQAEGYYGGTATFTGHYEVTNPDLFDFCANWTETYQYNNFSVIPGVSMTGTITGTDSEGTQIETITGNFTVLIGETSYNVECYFKFNYEDDNDHIYPDSYIKINGTSYPVTWDLVEIIANLGLLD